MPGHADGPFQRHPCSRPPCVIKYKPGFRDVTQSISITNSGPKISPTHYFHSEVCLGAAKRGGDERERNTDNLVFAVITLIVLYH